MSAKGKGNMFENKGSRGLRLSRNLGQYMKTAEKRKESPKKDKQKGHPSREKRNYCHSNRKEQRKIHTPTHTLSLLAIGAMTSTENSARLHYTHHAVAGFACEPLL